MDSIEFVIKKEETGEIVKGKGILNNFDYEYETTTAYGGKGSSTVITWENTIKANLKVILQEDETHSFLFFYDIDKILNENKHLKEVNKQLEQIISEYET